MKPETKRLSQSVNKMTEMLEIFFASVLDMDIIVASMGYTGLSLRIS